MVAGSYNPSMKPREEDTARQNLPESSPEFLNGLLRPVRKLLVFLIGMSVLLIGIAMIVLPGPATVVIPIGLAILATEFLWARRWLNYVKRRAQEMVDWNAKSKSPPAE